jgi:flap endonuclease-1
MGIDGFTKFLKSKAPTCIKQSTYNELTGVYAVDVSSYLFASQYNKITKSEGNHIREFFEMIVLSHQHKYLLIFVFDGDTHGEAKADTITERVDNRTKQVTKIKSLMAELNIPINDDDLVSSCHEYINNPHNFNPKYLELRDTLKNHIVLHASHFSDLKTLFDLAGQPYLQAVGEADHMISKLAKDGLIDGVFSEDLDMLTHGVPKLIRGVGSSRSTGEISIITRQDAINELGLTSLQFVELCILCGCDYAPTINGIGPVKGLAALREYRSIDGIISAIDAGSMKYIISNEFRKKWKIALDQFLVTHEVLPDTVIYWHVAKPELKEWISDRTNYTNQTLTRKITILPQEELMHVPPEIPAIPAIKIKVRVNPRIISTT